MNCALASTPTTLFDGYIASYCASELLNHAELSDCACPCGVGGGGSYGTTALEPQIFFGGSGGALPVLHTDAFRSMSQEDIQLASLSWGTIVCDMVQMSVSLLIIAKCHAARHVRGIDVYDVSLSYVGDLLRGYDESADHEETPVHTLLTVCLCVVLQAVRAWTTVILALTRATAVVS